MSNVISSFSRAVRSLVTTRMLRKRNELLSVLVSVDSEGEGEGGMDSEFSRSLSVEAEEGGVEVDTTEEEREEEEKWVGGRVVDEGCTCCGCAVAGVMVIE